MLLYTSFTKNTSDKFKKEKIVLTRYRKLFTLDLRQEHLSFHGYWVYYNGFFVLLECVFYGVGSAASCGTVVERQNTIRVVN